MKKLYSYMFPISLGAFALVATPVADSDIMISLLVLVGVVTLWLGITSVAKKTDENEQKMNLLLNSIEQQTEVVREIVTELQQNSEGVKGGLQNIQNALTELNDASEAKLIAMESNTETLTEELKKLKESHQTGNREIVNKQEELLRLTEELVEIQNELPNSFKELQDSISQTNDDQIEVIQGLETHVYEMKNSKESYHEQLLELNGKIIDTVNARVENLSMYIQEEATTLMKRSEDAQVIALKEVEAFGTLIKQIDVLNQQMQHVSKQNQEASVTELERLTEISAALLEGISQLTNSKSAERKQLLTVQKKLIEKFAD